MADLTFDHVIDRQIPAWEDTYEDITRPGKNAYKRTFIGHRSETAVVRATSFHTSEANAITKVATIEGRQGERVQLKDSNDTLEWGVFILSAKAEWRAVVHSDASQTHQVLATLTVQRES